MQIKLPRKKILLVGIVAIVILVGGLLLLNWPWKQYPGLKMSPKADIAVNIQVEPTVSIFSNTIYQLGYDKFLHNKGPFTVFVPVDTSYKNLPATTKDFLANKDNGGSLRQVLLYHVVKGEYRFADLRDGMKLKTLEGEELVIKRTADQVSINGYAYIKTYDIVSTNGVIHLTTNFLIPPTLSE